MWRLTICGARAAPVSVEHGCGLLTQHIFVWMIALHHCDGGSIMHDELFKEPTVVARYRAGPYVESREQFLKKPRGAGYSPRPAARLPRPLPLVLVCTHHT